MVFRENITLYIKDQNNRLRASLNEMIKDFNEVVHNKDQRNIVVAVGHKQILSWSMQMLMKNIK